MKLAKTLAVIACGGLLSAGFLGSPRYAYAQDAGGWGIGTGADTSDEATNPDTKTPADVGGDWCGTVKDKHDGKGSATFFLDQSGKTLLGDSDYDFEWGDGSFAFGPLTGTVNPNGFKFNGQAGEGCSVTGTANGNGSKLKGAVKFHGACKKFFGSGPLTIAPCPI
jgi:hypothetical protein